MNEPRRIRINFSRDPMRLTFINIRKKKNKFIAYIFCIRFNQSLEGKSCISAKIEAAVKYECTFFLTFNCGTAPTSNQNLKIHGLSYVIDVAWIYAVIGITTLLPNDFTLGLLKKCIRNVNFWM